MMKYTLKKKIGVILTEQSPFLAYYKKNIFNFQA